MIEKHSFECFSYVFFKGLDNKETTLLIKKGRGKRATWRDKQWKTLMKTM